MLRLIYQQFGFLHKALVIIVILLSSSTLNTLAQQVSEMEARTASMNYLKKIKKATSEISVVESIPDIDSNGVVLMYEIVFDNNISVIVSGNKNALPVLIVNENSNERILGAYNSFPCCLTQLLDYYRIQIADLYVGKAINSKMQSAWEKLLSLDQQDEPKTVNGRIGPLLSTSWGQEYGYNYYVSDYCSEGGKCPIGCTAVAMGQIMNYWKHPVVSERLKKQFDWCNMHDFISNEEDQEAISWLLYSCAVAIDMHFCVFNTCSSLGWPSEVRDALIRWGYSDDIQFNQRGVTSYETWSGMIRGELEAGRPVLYSGTNGTVSFDGHSIVCDGYDSETDLFHFNWGWYGQFDDLWVTLDYVGEGTINYSHHERIVRYISPESPSNYCSDTTWLDDFYSGFYNIPSNSVFSPLLIVPDKSAVVVSANEQCQSQYRTIHQGEIARYSARKEIILIPGFEAQEGCLFVADIDPCPNCQDGVEMVLSSTQDKSQYVEYDTSLHGGHGNDAAKTINASDKNDILLYPNPTSEDMTLLSKCEIKHVEIHGVYGNRVDKWFVAGLNGTRLQLNVSGMDRGVYFLSCIDVNGAKHVVKFIKK